MPVQVGLRGTVGNHFSIYTYLKKGYSGHVGLCDVAFKTAAMSSFALNSENLTVDTFLPLPGNASFLKRGRSGIARVELLTTELVESVGNKMQNL